MANLSPFTFDVHGLVRGKAKTLTFNITNEDGTPAALGSYTPSARAKKSRRTDSMAETVDLTASVSGDVFTLSITAAQSAALGEKNVIYCELDDGAGDNPTVGRGFINTIADIL